nr:acyltransferase family protein [Enterobacter bugandensis]
MMEHSSRAQLHINADLVRCVAITMVVLLHMSANSFYSQGENWGYSLLFDSLSRSCVPLFFMLSGSLLLTKNENAFSFYKKRLTKVAIPLLFWSYVYLLYIKFYIGKTDQSLSPAVIINGPVYYHLWFMYSIISVYIFVPILRFYCMNADKYLKLLILSIFIFSQSIQQYSGLFGVDLSIGIDIAFISRFFGFFLLGEFLTTHKPRLSNTWLAIGFIISTALTSYFTHKITIESGSPNETWFQYNSPFVIISSICLYLYLISVKNKSGKVISTVSNMSFGIYFIHIIIMQQLVVRFFFTPERFNSDYLPVLIPISTIACLGISTLIVLFISKIPYLRKVV